MSILFLVMILGQKQKANEHNPYFEGFYFKHQGCEGSVALIPAVHRTRNGSGASLQVVTASNSFFIQYPASAFSLARSPWEVRLGDSRFSADGVILSAAGPGVTVEGEVRYGAKCPLRHDIMGPFRLAEPVMQCYHGVFSMRHLLTGSLTINGQNVCFDGGTGYIETDRGRSFPRSYLWTQANWRGNSLMLSVAEIPLMGLRFPGCICAILFDGKEHRLATYLGAKIVRCDAEGAEVRQGRYRFSVVRLSGQTADLRAPEKGVMERTVREALCARVQYQFWRGDRLIFDVSCDSASFESCGLPGKKQTGLF